ncbi:hypothetical protein PO124_18975 [Bacillus licheniformis]|nr:hypothetical protein [Bacillus licheniformis]
MMTNFRKVEKQPRNGEKSMEDITKNETEYKADLAGFGNELRIKHPRLWEN